MRDRTAMQFNPWAVQNAGEWLATELNRLATLAVEDATHVLRQVPSATHALRVRMKIMRAVLDLAAGLPGKRRRIRKLRQACQRIKSSLAGSRDAEVLERLCQKWFGHALPLESSQASDSGSPQRLSGLLERLKLDVTRLDLADLTWQHILSRHARAYHRAKKAMRACQADASMEALHAWRKGVKRFYYQSLTLRWLPGSRRRIHRAQKLADLLGKDHDLSLLTTSLPLSNEPFDAAEKLACRQSSLRRKIFKLGRQLRFKKRQLEKIDPYPELIQ